MDLVKSARNYATASRFEYLPAILAGYWIGIFYAAESWAALLSPPVVFIISEGLVTFILLFIIGYLVNTWSDIRTDMLYKKHISSTVRYFGRWFVPIIVVHTCAAFLLCTHLAIVLSRPEILVLLSIGWLLGLGYSLEPLRFKKRGVMHFLIAVPIFFISGLFSYSLISPFIPGLIFYLFILIDAGVTVAHHGLVLFEQASDFPEDRKTGLRTPAVFMGLRKIMIVSLAFNIIGSFMIVAGMTIFFFIKNPVALPYIPFLIAGRYYSFRGVADITRKFGNKPDSVLLPEIREGMKRYPRWHAAGLFSVLAGFIISLTGI